MLQPSFASDLRTPSDSAEIRRSLHETWKEIEGVREKMKAIREEIERANESLQSLQALEKKLLSDASRTAPLLSPFQRFPRDILDEIAGNAAPFLVFNFANWNHGIWTLTHVCRAWRSALLSLPQLWSNLEIRFEGRGRVSPELLSLILARSGKHPLCFSLLVLQRMEDYETLSAIVSRLVEHSERWKRVRLDGCIPFISLLKVHRRLPLLESLQLYLTLADRTADLKGETYAFNVAPKLTKLEFASSLSLVFHFPLRQLRDVSCGWDAESATLGVCALRDLPHCSSLSSLVLTNWSPYFPSWNWRETKIVLPTLKYLGLKCHLGLLVAFRLPSLEKLFLDGFTIYGDDFAGVRHFFDSLPDGQLTHLILHELSANDTLITHELFPHPALHGLRALDITQRTTSFWGTDKQFCIYSLLLCLRCDISTPTLLPRLQSILLNFDYTCEEGDIFNQLKSFIISRTIMANEVRHITVVHDGAEPNLKDKDQNVPTRLHSFHIKFKSELPALTMDDLDRIEAGWLPKMRPTRS